MKKIDQIVLRVFLYGLPIVIIMAIISSFYDHNSIVSKPYFFQLYYNFSGLVFGVWMFFSLYLSARLIVSKSFREETLCRLAFFKERDERETFLTGNATRMSYLTSLSILICFLCLSVFQIYVYQEPPEKAVNSKRGIISLGVSLSLVEGDKTMNKHKPSDVDKNYFSYSGLPVSKTAIILFLIIWQIISYNYWIRRTNAP